jgi:hypothetical protein
MSGRKIPGLPKSDVFTRASPLLTTTENESATNNQEREGASASRVVPQGALRPVDRIVLNALSAHEDESFRKSPTLSHLVKGREGLAAHEDESFSSAQKFVCLHADVIGRKSAACPKL